MPEILSAFTSLWKRSRGSQRVDVESQSKGENAEQDISGGYILEKGWNFSERVELKPKSLATNFSSHIRMQILYRLSSEATCSNISMI